MIHAIGDSHASIFSGLGTKENTYMIPIYPQPHENIDSMFKAYRIGPATAYNLESKLPIINNILSKYVDKEKDSVLMIFGEIDMRIHVYNQVIERAFVKKEDIIKEIADRYFNTILKIKNEGYNIIILAPSAQSFATPESDYIKDGFKYPMEFPIGGTNKSRNEYTKIFTEMLMQKGIEYNIKVISILDEMLDENGETKPDLFMDYLHLSSITLPLIKSKL